MNAIGPINYGIHSKLVGLKAMEGPFGPFILSEQLWTKFTFQNCHLLLMSNETLRKRNMTKFVSAYVAIVLAATVTFAVTFNVDAMQENTIKNALTPDQTTILDKFSEAKKSLPYLRVFLTKFPKGGDLHNHLVGAIYAESYIAWGAEDGLCINPQTFGLIPPEKGKACDISAKQAMQSGPLRDKTINALSMRSFNPSNGWSGHDQFFSTFDKMYYANFYQYGGGPLRSGDMLAELSSRAAAQNLGYLELLHTMELGSILSMVPANFGEKEKSIAGLYKALMRGPFGKALPQLVSNARAHLDLATKRRDLLLDCKNSGTGCDVNILFLHQVIREFSSPQVFAQLILGAELARADHRMVGLNMVAPEDGAIAMADYGMHMKMINFLWQKEAAAGGDLNVSLHAGELTLGLVSPKELRSHIRSAIEIGHAKRIGHGVAIAYEDNPEGLVQKMAEDEIMVEINLSSNDAILGIKGSDHPYALYKDAGVPMALSTDDEGVSRIDITNEYIRAVTEQDVTYEDLLQLSRNSLTYSFIPGESLWQKKSISNAACAQDLGADKSSPSPKCQTFLESSAKAKMQWQLEQNIHNFEAYLLSRP